MLIETKRLRLTHFTAEYTLALHGILQDPRIFTYLPESVPDLTEVQSIIKFFIKRDKDNDKGFKGTNLAVILKNTKRIIGWCGIQPFEPMPDKFEIFFGLSPDYWNLGYTTEAAAAVLAYGFNTLGLPEIVAGVKPQNKASIAVLEKIGMIYQQPITQVPKGSDFYLGERLYALTKARYGRNKP